MPSTNFSRYARVPEVTRGVTPATPAMQLAVMTGEGMKPTDAFARSEAITGDRAIAEHLRVGQSVAGSFATEMAGGWHDWLFELAMFDRFVGAVEAYNFSADQNVTDVAVGTQTLSAAGAWLAGMIVNVSGMGVAGNNVDFVAQAGSGAGTVIAPAATFAADEATPPIGARALFRGFQAAVGDLVIAADGITSTLLDFTTMPIPADACIKIEGFGVAAVDIYAPVVSVTQNKITLRKLPAAWAASVGIGAGLTGRILVGEPVEPGADVLTETHEKSNSKTSPVAYEKFVGVACNSLVIPLQQDAIVRPNASLVGFSGGVSETAVGASYSTPSAGETKRPMKTGSNVGRLVEGSTDDAVASCVTSAQITINNNLTPAKCIAHDAPVDWNEGDFEFIVEGDFRFANKTIMEKYYAGTESGFFIVIQRGGWAYAIELHSAVYTDMGGLNSARNAELTLKGRLEGFKSATTGKVATISRFRKFS